MTTENQAANVIGAGLSPGSLRTPYAASRSSQYYDLIMAAFVVRVQDLQSGFVKLL